jgi:hypothetical protein
MREGQMARLLLASITFEVATSRGHLSSQYTCPRAVKPRLILCALIPVAGAVACGRSPLMTPPLTSTPLEAGRTYTTWFYEGAVDDLWARLSPSLQVAFHNKSGLRAFRQEVRAQMGTEQNVAEERITPWLSSSIYSRTAAFDGYPQPVLVQWTLADDGIALGFLVVPLTPTAANPHADRETRTPLRLPFDDEWFVFWGGRSVVENHHAVAPDQRFGYDFTVARDGRTYSGDPTQNTSYFCFGRAVLAPGAGTVVVAEDGIADNRPGVMNSDQPLGNHVVVDHGNGEFSFLAHLRSGSVVVATGDTVQAGLRVGACGNSGNSSEPHLHYHLQDTSRFGHGVGLPAQFREYLADGAPVQRGEPTRGQRVRPAE